MKVEVSGVKVDVQGGSLGDESGHSGGSTEVRWTFGGGSFGVRADVRGGHLG